MQQGVSPDDYEIIVVDNGSSSAIDEEACSQWGGNLRFHRMPNPQTSPTFAINAGLAIAPRRAGRRDDRWGTYGVAGLVVQRLVGRESVPTACYCVAWLSFGARSPDAKRAQGLQSTG